MCSHVLRVKYKASVEPAQLLAFDDQESLDKRIGELQAQDTVAELKVFNIAQTLRRVEEWRKV